MRGFLLILSLISSLYLSACSSVITVMPATKSARPFTVEYTLQKYLTPEARQAVQDIPTVDGINYSPYVAGVNFWSSLWALVSGTGIGRKVVINRNSDTEITLIHEYVHQLDDMSRDGLIDLISLSEFRSAWAQLQKDQKYVDAAKEIERLADRWVTNFFGIGELSEQIAYTSTWLVTDGGPEYMWYVFRKVLIRPRVRT